MRFSVFVVYFLSFVAFLALLFFFLVLLSGVGIWAAFLSLWVSLPPYRFLFGGRPRPWLFYIYIYFIRRPARSGAPILSGRPSAVFTWVRYPYIRLRRSVGYACSVSSQAHSPSLCNRAPRLPLVRSCAAPPTTWNPPFPFGTSRGRLTG